MALTRFLAEIRTRARTTSPVGMDPLGVILRRLGATPHRIDAKVLRKGNACRYRDRGRMTDTDLWALGKDALGLLDAFALARLTGRYTALELEIYGQRLRGGAA